MDSAVSSYLGALSKQVMSVPGNLQRTSEQLIGGDKTRVALSSTSAKHEFIAG